MAELRHREARVSSPSGVSGSEPVGNLVLDSLAPVAREQLLEGTALREMPVGATMFRANEPIDEVYFPLTGVMSIVSQLEDGSSVEVATVGNEGIVGMLGYLGIGQTSLEANSQVPGIGIPVPAQRLKEQSERDPDLRDLLNRYACALMVQIGQSAACNAVHNIQQRASRWMLMTHDRMNSDEYLLTQEVLATMLGVRAATISEKASLFQRMGLISYQRGRMTIHDRPGLEKLTCECYQIIRDEYVRQLGKAVATV